MTKKSKFLLIVLVFIMALALIIPGIGHKHSDAPPVKQGENMKAPNFLLENFDGGKIALDNFKGKVVLINFWATWCPPCRHELPDIARLREELKDRGFEVIGVILEAKSPQVMQKVNQLRNQFGMKYPLAWGTNKIVQDYGNISAIPQSFIVDTKGNIVKVFVGARDYDTFKSVVIELLQK